MKTIKNKHGDVYAGQSKHGTIFLDQVHSVNLNHCKKCTYQINVFTCAIKGERGCSKFGTTGYYDNSIDWKIKIFLDET